ncbi:MAG TPA: ABC transporter permease [Puia sp.]|nr:ABC transporter permease [Puia sp.]
MLRNYLKVALRNLWKSKGFTAINIIGLAAGLGVCLLIVLYVTDELSYDRFNVNADRIYRLDADIYFNGTQFTAAISPKPLAYTLAKECPQVEQMVRINYQKDILIKKGAEWIRDHHVAFADSTFFKVFSIPMVTGDPNTALNEPNSVVIDESAARRYFNSTDVIGKTLEMENKTLCKVTGVMQDFPRQSHFHLSFIRPVRDSYQGDNDRWLSNNWYSYILARPGVDRAFLQSRVNATVDKYLGRQLQEMLHTSIADMNHQGAHFIYHLMPLTDIHLHSNKSYEMEPNGNINYIYIFSFIAILILVIACVNFMNLSTARSAGRAKEVGIRKVAGSTRGHLIAQFLTESVLLSFFSLLLALGIALLLLPMFNQLAGKELHAGSLFSVRFLALLVTLVFLVGCLAGSYPAFYLSSFQPILVLKGKIAAGFKGSMLRSILVVGQFWISIGLIVCTIVIYNQLNYIRSRQVGFDRDQVLVIHNAYLAGDPVKTFRKELTQLTGVAGATLSGDLPTQGGGYDQEGWFRTASLDPKGAVVLTNFFVDNNYVPTLGMKIVKGRNFSPDFPTDSTGIIVNESAVRLLGWKNPINQTFYRPGDSMKSVAYHVIGVIKDFNFSSMHDKVGPLVINLSDSRGSLAVRLHGGDIFATVGQIESKWKAMANGVPFSYTFMDDDFNTLYQSEKQTGQLFIAFAVFAIFIACLGLFGLVTYAAEQRMKEIGIRKVLGARVSGIVGLLSKDFALLVGIAALIAFPVAWWAMYKWLETFAYRTGISWWIFLVAGLTALAIALLTVSIQTIRAAVANPVKSLRSE